MPALERTLRWIAFWLPLGICTWLALGPGLPPEAPKVSDVTMHLVAFVYLTAALFSAYQARPWWWVALWMAAYGALIEFLQGFFPLRSPEMKDFLVDLVGIGIGLLAYRLAGEWVWRQFLRLLRV